MSEGMVKGKVNVGVMSWKGNLPQCIRKDAARQSRRMLLTGQRIVVVVQPRLRSIAKTTWQYS
jgi:hypothetical protein